MTNPKNLTPSQRALIRIHRLIVGGETITYLLRHRAARKRIESSMTYGQIVDAHVYVSMERGEGELGRSGCETVIL